MYELGRSKLSEEYAKWEQPQKVIRRPIENNIMKDFLIKLSPAPNQYSTDLFDYYVMHSEQINHNLKQKDKDRLIELLKKEVLKFNPAAY